METLRGNGQPSNDDELREAANQAWSQVAHLEENMRQLEDVIVEDEGWRRLTAETDVDFTRSGLKQLVETSRAMYLTSPLIKRAVDVTSFYTWAQGVTYTARDEKVQELVVTPMTTNQNNVAELYGHQARILTDVDLQVDGSVFFSMATDEAGNVELFSIPVQEVSDIYTVPGRGAQVMYYRRVWVEQELDLESGTSSTTSHEALYPDWQYQPERQPESIGGIAVHWDQPVIFAKTGGLKHMRFGVPTTYAAMDWARAYKKFLENWHTLVASLARFAWVQTTKSRNVGDRKRKLQERPEAAGAVAVLGGDDHLAPIPKTGATTSAEDARPSRLMVASSMNLPDTILSNDPQQGALATAKTLDRPTELYMSSRQSLWAAIDQDIFKYKVRVLQERGRLGTDIDPVVDVTFPDILEHDPEAAVRAIVSAATLDGKAEAGTMPRETMSRMLMETVGVEDVEDALANIDADQADALNQAVEALAEATRGLREQ